MVRKKDKLVYGVGINDADYTQQIMEELPRINGRRRQKLVWICPYYACWRDMLKRAYAKSYYEKHATYQDVTVCEEWHRFSNFKCWMETQDWKGKQLDKDILVDGNKVYSPETCCFISQRLNKFMLGGSKDALHSIGAYYRSDIDKFQSRVRDGSTRKNLGYFPTEQEAHLAWAKAKRNILSNIIQEECLAPNVAQALIRKYDNILQNARKEVECLIQVVQS